MIIFDDEASQAGSSERSPLKSPVAPVTAARHGSPIEPAPPTYISTNSSFAHLPQRHHPQSPVSPHPHSPHPHSPHPHAYIHVHHPASIHSIPPHIVKLIEEREIRHKTLYRFFTSLAVAFFILLAWSTLIRGVTLTIIHSTSRNAIEIEHPEAPPSPSHLHYVQWSQAYSRPGAEPQRPGPNDAKSFSLKLPVLIPQPSVSLTITPTPVAERILSIAYPPFPSPSQSDN